MLVVNFSASSQFNSGWEHSEGAKATREINIQSMGVLGARSGKYFHLLCWFLLCRLERTAAEITKTTSRVD